MDNDDEKDNKHECPSCKKDLMVDKYLMLGDTTRILTASYCVICKEWYIHVS